MKSNDILPGSWRGWRRLRAGRLKRAGWYQRDIAEALGVSEVAASRWLARARDGGIEALLDRPAPGRPSELTPARRALIPELLGHGPEAYGSRGRVWTRARVARVIERGFGVAYHGGHVARLPKESRRTPRAPIRRATRRDEAAIEHGRRVARPGSLKRARRGRRVPVFVDESGFYLLPAVVKTYAPEGRTPALGEKLTRDHLSVMAGMTPGGKLYTPARQGSLSGWRSIEPLVHLGRVAGGRRLAIWDGSPIRRRSEVTRFVSDTRGAAQREAPPGYAPGLNPWDEGGRNHLEHVEKRDLVSRDLEELHEQFRLAIGRVRHKPHPIRSFFAQAGLELEV
jgi:transposase